MHSAQFLECWSLCGYKQIGPHMSQTEAGLPEGVPKSQCCEDRVYGLGGLVLASCEVGFHSDGF